MSGEMKPDMSCVPYRRKGVYLVLTVPLVLLLISVAVYLGTVRFILAVVFVALYVGMCYFQAYCCAYQECPYVDGFCPAIVGIVPAGRLARWLYGRRRVVKSKAAFETQAALAFGCWMGLVFFPLWWIAKRSVPLAVGYVVLHAVYYVIFGLTICPACAIRGTCPGGKLQSIVLGGPEQRSR